MTETTGRKRFRTVIVILAVTAVLTQLSPLLSRPVGGARMASQVSMTLGQWTGEDLPVDEDTIRILQTDDIVDRRYSRPGSPSVDLTIVYAKEQRKVAHPQEICLKGAGFNIQGSSRVVAPTGLTSPAGVPVVRLMVEKGSSKYLIYYWYKCRGRYTASYYWENALVIWSNVTLHPANGALIKLTTPLETDTAVGEARLREFLALVMPEIESRLR